MVPAHHVVEMRLVGCPDPDPDLHPLLHARPRGAARRPRRDRTALHRRPRRRGADGSRLWRRAEPGEPIGVCFSGGIDSGAVFLVTYHAMLTPGALPRPPQGVRADLGKGADLDQARAFLGPPRPRRSSSRRSRRIRPSSTWTRRSRPRGLQAARRASARRWASPSAAASARRYPGLAAPRRRRRRRREPEGLPDRGEPGADDPQRGEQSHALPGGLGRRAHQALADLQRRPEPQLRPHLRARPPLRLRPGSARTRGRVSIEVAEGIPFVALTAYDVPGSTR